MTTPVHLLTFTLSSLPVGNYQAVLSCRTWSRGVRELDTQLAGSLKELLMNSHAQALTSHYGMG